MIHHLAKVYPFSYECAARDNDGFEYLCGVTFLAHDPNRFACICENPLRPYKNCPAHRGRAWAMDRAGIELGGWRK